MQRSFIDSRFFQMDQDDLKTMAAHMGIAVPAIPTVNLLLAALADQCDVECINTYVGSWFAMKNAKKALESLSPSQHLHSTSAASTPVVTSPQLFNNSEFEKKWNMYCDSVFTPQCKASSSDPNDIVLSTVMRRSLVEEFVNVSGATFEEKWLLYCKINVPNLLKDSSWKFTQEELGKRRDIFFEFWAFDSSAVSKAASSSSSLLSPAPSKTPSIQTPIAKKKRAGVGKDKDIEIINIVDDAQFIRVPACFLTREILLNVIGGYKSTSEECPPFKATDTKEVLLDFCTKNFGGKKKKKGCVFVPLDFMSKDDMSYILTKANRLFKNCDMKTTGNKATLRECLCHAMSNYDFA